MWTTLFVTTLMFAVALSLAAIAAEYVSRDL